MIHTIKTHTSKLKILKNWDHYNVFNNYLLHLASSNLLSDYISFTLFLIILTKGIKEFKIKVIINFCMHRDKLQFLIQWVNYNKLTNSLRILRMQSQHLIFTFKDT